MLINKYGRTGFGIFYHPDGDNGAPVVPPVTPPTTPPVVPPSQEDDEAYDKPRALATIANLRKFEIEAKRLQRELDAAKKTEDDRKTAELSEVQKAEKKAADAQAALDGFKARHRTTAIKSAIRLAAATAGFVDVEDAVLHLAENSTIELGDDDKVSGATEAVKALATAKPHLLAATRPAAPNINATGGGNPPPITTDAVVQQKRQSGQYVPF